MQVRFGGKRSNPLEIYDGRESLIAMERLGQK